MIKKDELIKWAENYDYIKYPYGIYNELVVEGIEHENKIALMGAWKTGSLRVDENGKEYKDKNGFSYMFTNRWNNSAPVGSQVWNYISRNQEVIKSRIPKEFPLEKPEIAVELQERKGFGFIWTVFVLHCFYPVIYPLFDQHVYRAYRFIITDGKECPNLAPDDWNEYLNYKIYFNELLNDSKIPYYQLDKALWAYGKYIKQNSKIIIKKKSSLKKDIVDHKNIVLSSKGNSSWVCSMTLGGKAKTFWWKVDNNFDIHIKRKFKTFESMNYRVISKEQLEKIDDFIKSREWINLSNNVEKINNGTEKEGLGKFLYDVLNWQAADVQLASHIGAIFTLAGAWGFNGYKRGIQFKKNNIDWKRSILTYYSENNIK
ncbi:MAG: hypothetical protein VB130_07090 [Clostridium sp.]|nr:hypothetical protein [Clostridium sp.]